MSQAHLRERAIFQACLTKMALSWKCIGRQPDSEGSLSRAVHGICHYFTGIFHLLSHSIFLIWPYFYDKSLEKCKPDNLWSNHLLKVIFLQKTHYFQSVQSLLHFPKPLHPVYPQIPYLHRTRKWCDADKTQTVVLPADQITFSVINSNFFQNVSCF